MKFWWLTDSVRLGAEKRAVEAIAGKARWFRFDRWCLREGNLSAEGTICAHGHSYPVRLIYPDQFPHVPAWIEPQDDVRWTTHQYGTGTLCLEHRPDNWTVTTTGVDVLCSAHRLLLTEDPLGEGGAVAPSAHRIGEIQSYDWNSIRAFIGTACVGRIREGGPVDLTAIMWLVADGTSPILVQDSVDRQATRRPSKPDIFSWQIDIPAFASLNPGPTEVLGRSELVAAGGFDTETLSQLPAEGAILVLFVGKDEVDAYHCPNAGVPRKHSVLLLPEQSGQRSGRAPSIESKQVAIVGAGSVGSKIAEILVRSGVSVLTLIDGDVLLPDNLERHTLDWRDVGLRKVTGLKRRLLCIVPGAEVEVIPDNLNWQRSARMHAWQVSVLARCDVVVDATGDPSTSLFLGAVADANGRAFVSAEIFEGGLGALVATCLPSRDPPFSEGRAAFLAWCDEQDAPLPKSGTRSYEVIGDGGIPMVADDAAVTAAAGHTARAVLDILDGEPAPVSSAWLLFGFRSGWVFEGHGHTIRINVGQRRPAEEGGDDAEARSFAEDLLKDAVREAPAES